MKRKENTIFMAVLVAAVIAIGGFYYANRVPFEQRPPRVGQRAPEIDLVSLSGAMVSLSEHKGKVVLVNFFATWCPPCRDEMKWFEKAQRKYLDRGFLVVALSLDEVKPAFAAKLGVTFPLALANDRVTEAYGEVSNVPVSFLVGTDGRVIKKVWRLYDEDDLMADIEAALKAAP